MANNGLTIASTQTANPPFFWLSEIRAGANLIYLSHLPAFAAGDAGRYT